MKESLNGNGKNFTNFSVNLYMFEKDSSSSRYILHALKYFIKRLRKTNIL